MGHKYLWFFSTWSSRQCHKNKMWYICQQEDIIVHCTQVHLILLIAEEGNIFFRVLSYHNYVNLILQNTKNVILFNFYKVTAIE